MNGWSVPGAVELELAGCLVRVVCQPDPAARGVASLWLLDVGAGWAMTAAAHRLAAVRPDATAIAPGAVIGVMPLAASSGSESRADLLGGAGSDGFVAALTGDVVPEVAGRWGLDRDAMTVAGHSLAGRLALQVALAHPGVFRRVAAISPSLWHRRGELAPLLGADRGGRPLDLLLTAGEHEAGLAPWEEGREGSAGTLTRRLDRAMVDRVREFSSHAREHGMDARAVVLPGADHASAQADSLTVLLRFAFPAG